ncbi:hypothetical protein SADUNF_Sadunf09G0098300 [Salix dunnii]|uniref:Uncharacterized protein n=1 Tax=Salix dunnii TaxID=1413687 RepID=A0A835JWN5_9ROSI|nr:hypothetical protein SADUNF_Sadunf09G0098300 [Salix dunnii]
MTCEHLSPFIWLLYLPAVSRIKSHTMPLLSARARSFSLKMENQTEQVTFDMDALRANLPQKRRGLSRYYSGKARSFTCIADVRCLEDLKKPECPDSKKKQKYSDRNGLHVPPYPCRRVSSSTQCLSPCVGV